MLPDPQCGQWVSCSFADRNGFPHTADRHFIWVSTTPTARSYPFGLVSMGSPLSDGMFLKSTDSPKPPAVTPVVPPVTPLSPTSLTQVTPQVFRYATRYPAVRVTFKVICRLARVAVMIKSYSVFTVISAVAERSPT